MAFFSGVDFGNDEIGEMSLYEDTDMYDEPSGRHYSGYDYHPDGGQHRPPLPTAASRKKYGPRPRRSNVDTWRLKQPTKQREGFLDIDIDNEWTGIAIIFIILLVIIYCTILIRAAIMYSTCEIVAILKDIMRQNRESK